MQPLNPATGEAFEPTFDVRQSNVAIQIGSLADVRTSLGAFTQPAPVNPGLGDAFGVRDASLNAAVNPITVSGNGKTIDGAASVTLSVNGVVAAFVYDGTEWKRALAPQSVDDKPVGVTCTATIPSPGLSVTGTGIPHVVAGVLAGAASLIVDADVDAAAAIAGTKVSPNFGAQDVQTTGNVLVGATPRAAAGLIRVGSNQSILRGRNAANTADLRLLETDASDNLYIGTDSGFTVTQPAIIRMAAQSSFVIGIQGTRNFSGDATSNLHGYPTWGDSSMTSPWGAIDGEVAVNMNNANATLGATEYVFKVIRVTSTAAFTAIRTLTFPAPASAAAAYCKFVRNTQAGAFAVRCSTGAGTTVDVAQARGAWVLFNEAGCVRMTADSVV